MCNKEAIGFLNGQIEDEEYLEKKTIIRKERWGDLSYKEMRKNFEEISGIEFYYYDQFLNSGYKQLPKHHELWLDSMICYIPKLVYKILKIWREKPPNKKVIEDLRKILSLTLEEKIKFYPKIFRNNFINYFFINIGKKELNPHKFDDIDLMRREFDFQQDATLTTQEAIETLKNLIYFGIVIEENIFNILEDSLASRNAEFIKEATVIIEEALAGRKIANYIKNQLDDEYVLSPLRKKIDLRKFQKLMDEQKS